MTSGLKNNIFVKTFLVLAVSFIAFFPLITDAQESEQTAQEIERQGLVHCGRGDVMCTFTDLFILVERIITFGLFVLALPLATISIAVAGFKFIVAGDNSGERQKAKEILINVVIGLVLAFAAWIIVDTIVDALVETESVTDERGFESPTNKR